MGFRFSPGYFREAGAASSNLATPTSKSSDTIFDPNLSGVCRLSGGRFGCLFIRLVVFPARRFSGSSFFRLVAKPSQTPVNFASSYTVEQPKESGYTPEIISIFY